MSDLEQTQSEPKPEERSLGLACHLLALAGLVVPFGNILGPLIMWLVKKDESAFVDDQGKEALNFNITISIAGFIAFLLMFVVIGGLLLPCQEFGPAMCKRGKGSIINIASVTSHLPLSKVIAYSASKAAVLSATRFLAREWATKGVRVNSITPGFFPAEQNRKLLFNEDGTPSDRAKAIFGHTPMGRFGDPSELAGAAVYLASEKAASFVTGSDIVVDGGFLSTTI